MSSVPSKSQLLASEGVQGLRNYDESVLRQFHFSEVEIRTIKKNVVKEEGYRLIPRGGQPVCPAHLVDAVAAKFLPTPDKNFVKPDGQVHNWGLFAHEYSAQYPEEANTGFSLRDTLKRIFLSDNLYHLLETAGIYDKIIFKSQNGSKTAHKDAKALASRNDAHYQRAREAASKPSVRKQKKDEEEEEEEEAVLAQATITTTTTTTRTTTAAAAATTAATAAVAAEIEDNKRQRMDAMQLLDALINNMGDMSELIGGFGDGELTQHAMEIPQTPGDYSYVPTATQVVVPETQEVLPATQLVQEELDVAVSMLPTPSDPILAVSSQPAVTQVTDEEEEEEEEKQLPQVLAYVCNKCKHTEAISAVSARKYICGKCGKKIDRSNAEKVKINKE